MPEPTEPDTDFLLATKHRQLAQYMRSHHQKTVAFIFVCAAFYATEAFAITRLSASPPSTAWFIALTLAHAAAITLAFARISQYRKTLFELNLLAKQSDIHALGGETP
jgi:uncharacterized membrane protein